MCRHRTLKNEMHSVHSTHCCLSWCQVVLAIKFSPVKYIKCRELTYYQCHFCIISFYSLYTLIVVMTSLSSFWAEYDDAHRLVTLRLTVWLILVYGVTCIYILIHFTLTVVLIYRLIILYCCQHAETDTHTHRKWSYGNRLNVECQYPTAFAAFEQTGSCIFLFCASLIVRGSFLSTAECVRMPSPQSSGCTREHETSGLRWMFTRRLFIIWSHSTYRVSVRLWNYIYSYVLLNIYFTFDRNRCICTHFDGWSATYCLLLCNEHILGIKREQVHL